MREASQAEPKIEFSGVERVFPPPAKTAKAVTAVSGLNLSIMESEIVSIVGPTGCGKSTAMNMVAGFDHGTSGRLVLDGKPIAGPGPERSVVFQHAALFPWMNVLQNVTFGVKTRGMPADEYLDKAATLLKAVGLTGFEKHYPYQLSGGMQQRVQIARALISSPDVLLMDEPFGALVYQTRILMQQLLLELWGEFKPTILFITHDIGEAIYVSDRVVVMTARPGKVKIDVRVDEPKPRSLDFLTSTDFKDLEHVILASVQEEITATYAQAA